MPDININPSAIANRADSAAPNGKDSTPGPSKPPPLTTSNSHKGNKPAQVLPRVDLEPLYTGLKSGIGDKWATYKQAVSHFVLGGLSAQELTHRTAPFLGSSDTLVHQHNQLLLAIATNLSREAPDVGVAPWVSANDKPTTTTKPLAGDAAEHRLKVEVMQLPPRVRTRIKGVNDESIGPLVAGLAGEAAARRPAVAGSGSVGGVSTPLTATMPTPSTSTTTGLNKDQEIRKRYGHALIQESQDLPAKSAILERVLPMCYEERLNDGAGLPNQVAGLMSAAMGVFVKESLSSMISVGRINPPVSDTLALTGEVPSNAESNGHGHGVGPLGIFTAGYKRRIERETRQVARGELKRSESGLLPIEVQAQKRANWGRGWDGDAKLAWDMRDPTWWRPMVPWASERIMPKDWDDREDDEMEIDGVGIVPKKIQSNGVNGIMVNGNGARTDHDRDGGAMDEMAIDEMDWGWEGADNAGRTALGGLLDDCLLG